MIILSDIDQVNKITTLTQFQKFHKEFLIKEAKKKVHLCGP